MDDLERYIEKRKKKSPGQIGVLLRQMRKEAGLTQEQVAEQLHTKKTANSRIENHAEDIRLSTLEKYIEALGKKLHLEIV